MRYNKEYHVRYSRWDTTRNILDEIHVMMHKEYHLDEIQQQGISWISWDNKEYV